jgi:hypothetical protein
LRPIARRVATCLSFAAAIGRRLRQATGKDRIPTTATTKGKVGRFLAPLSSTDGISDRQTWFCPGAGVSLFHQRISGATMLQTPASWAITGLAPALSPVIRGAALVPAASGTSLSAVPPTRACSSSQTLVDVLSAFFAAKIDQAYLYRSITEEKS